MTFGARIECGVRIAPGSFTPKGRARATGAVHMHATDSKGVVEHTCSQWRSVWVHGAVSEREGESRLWSLSDLRIVEFVMSWHIECTGDAGPDALPSDHVRLEGAVTAEEVEEGLVHNEGVEVSLT